MARSVASDSRTKGPEKQPRKKPKREGGDEPVRIVLLSEATGSLAQHMASVALSQFGKLDHEIHSVPFCNSAAKVRESLDQFQRDYPTGRTVVLLGLASRSLRRVASNWCAKAGVAKWDLLDGLVEFFREQTGHRPSFDASQAHRHDDSYFRRIDAWEFTLQHDDSRRLDSIHQADIVLVGVSRSGKTPLAAYLGSLGYKVANVSIAPESGVPQELNACRDRVVGLTLQPRILSRIRERRMELNGFAAAMRQRQLSNDYTTNDVAVRDLMFAEQTFRRLAAPQIDVSELTIEEMAAKVVSLLNLPAP